MKQENILLQENYLDKNYEIGGIYEQLVIMQKGNIKTCNNFMMALALTFYFLYFEKFKEYYEFRLVNHKTITIPKMNTKPNQIFNKLQKFNFKHWMALHLPQPSKYLSIGETRKNESYEIGTNEKEKEEEDALINEFPLESCRLSIIIRIIIYFLEILLVLVMMFICNSQIESMIDDVSIEILGDTSIGIIIGVLGFRILSNLAYVLFYKQRTNFHYMMNKLLQTISFFLFNISISLNSGIFLLLFILTLAFELLSDIVHIYCKEQRYGYFDSRLTYSNYILRAISSYFAISIFTVYSKDFSETFIRLGIIMVLFVCSICHLVCIIKDTVYSLMTINVHAITWIICAFNILYQLVGATLQLLKSPDNFNLNLERLHTDNLSSEINFSYILPALISIVFLTLTFYNRRRIGTWNLNRFHLLKEEFASLNTRELKIEYLWQAVRLISVGCEDIFMLEELTAGINWTLSRYCLHSQCSSQKLEGKNFSMATKKKIKEKSIDARDKAFLNFYEKFSKHTYRLMMETLNESEEIKYLLIFFFNDFSAERMLLYLRNEKFFDIRENHRIVSEHRSTDLAAKINEMEKLEIEINNSLKEYVQTLKSLLEHVENTSGIDLEKCEMIGERIIALQSEILEFGLDHSIEELKGTKNGSFAKNSPILSEYCKNLLNIIRKEMIGAPVLSVKHSFQQEECLLSEIMDVEESLFLVSAEPESVGEIIAINPAASKLTYFLEKELIGQRINILIPDGIHASHDIHLQKSIKKERTSDKSYSIDSVIYIVKKNKYCSPCRLLIRFMDGTMGKRWLVKLQEIEERTPVIICDKDNNILGFNECALRVGIGFDWLGINLGEEFIKGMFMSDSEKNSMNEIEEKEISNVWKLKSMSTDMQEIIMNSNYYSNKQRIPKESESSDSPANSRVSLGNESAMLSVNSKYKRRRSSHHNLLTKMSTILECSIIGLCNSIGAEPIEGYYIIKMEEKVHNRMLASIKNGIISRGNLEIEKEKYYQPLEIVKKEHSNFKNSPSPLGNKPYSIEVLNAKESETYFEFKYNSKLNEFNNQMSKNTHLQTIVNESSEIEGEKINQFLSEEKVEIFIDDINELIYLNGSLEFRENKKLEEKQECETHPLHKKLESCEFEDESERMKEIESKDKIYELLQLSVNYSDCKEKREKIIFKYSKQHKTLFCLLIVFLLIYIVLSVLMSLGVSQIGEYQNQNILAMTLMGLRVNSYNRIASTFNQIVLLNLNESMNNANTNSLIVPVSEIINTPENWYSLIKQIESDASVLASITSLDESWQSSTFQEFIPGLKTERKYSEQAEIFLLQLQKLKLTYETSNKFLTFGFNSITETYRYQVDQRLLSECLETIRCLIEEVIPIKLNALYQVPAYYEKEIKKMTFLIKIEIIVLCGLTLLIAILVYLETRSIHLLSLKNLEIFALFPDEQMESLKKKLEKLEDKINTFTEVNSEIGFEKETEENIEEKLLFHKKKVMRRNNWFSWSGLLMSLSFVGLALTAVIFFDFEMLYSCRTSILQNWYLLNNAEILKINYEWELNIIKNGIERDPDVANFFKRKKPFNEVPFNNIISIPRSDITNNLEFILMYRENLENKAKEYFSEKFVSEKAKIMNKSLCQFTEEKMRCTELIYGYEVKSIEEYLQIKKYSFETIFNESISKNKSDEYKAALTFFNLNYSKPIEETILKLSQSNLELELSRRQEQFKKSLILGIVAISVIFCFVASAIISYIHKSKEKITRPIFILTRLLPLRILNSNSTFLQWYHKTKNEELR